MKLLVIGSGGREHALTHTFHRQGHKVFCLPGNPGTEPICQPITREWKMVHVNQHAKLAKFTKEHRIDLTVVGPEAPLAGGIVDLFSKNGLQIFGPTQQATSLESSKVWAKNFLAKYSIPTAHFVHCSNSDETRVAIRSHFEEWKGVVIKPDGLTAGKGVVPCDTPEEAEEAVRTIMDEGQYGAAGNEVIVEEKLAGREVSILAFCDGNEMVPMIPSQDHKRLYEEGLGPNTGGVGAYTPLPFLTEKEKKIIHQEIIERTNDGLKKEGILYKGILYFGLMLTDEGPKVLEFNCRFGDPEAQVVLPLIESDLAEIMQLCCQGNLSKASIRWKQQAACCVVMVSGGYPGKFETGHEIQGLEKLQNRSDLICFHSGTTRNKSGHLTTSGGRVLGLTGLGKTLEEAIETAYSGVKEVHFNGAFFRKDIAREGRGSGLGFGVFKSPNPRPVPLYTSQEKPMHIVVFGSGSGTNLEALLRAQRDFRPPLFEVKALFTDRKCRFHEIAERECIPLIYSSFLDFFKERGMENKQDFETRIEFDKQNIQLIEESAEEHNFTVNLIFLAGYMRMLYPPLLNYFRNKIINVHPADLTIKNAKGNRLYVGPNTVYDALMNGEARTRSSVILIDENMDTGPILVSSPWIPYTEGYPVTDKRAAYHQNKQKTLGDWPASVKAIELIAKGKISLDENRIVYVNDAPQPEGGYVLKEVATPV